MLWLEYILIMFALCVFGFAAYKDYKTRMVANRVWLVGAVGGLVLSVLGFGLFGGDWLSYAIVNLFTSGLGIGLFYLHGWGGADGKAVVCLGLMFGGASFYVLFLSLVLYLFGAVTTFLVDLKKGYIFREAWARFWRGKAGLPFLVFLFAGFIVCVLEGVVP